MYEDRHELIKYSTNLAPATIQALKRLAAVKVVPACFVIWSTIKKAVPAKWFEESK